MRLWPARARQVRVTMPDPGAARARPAGAGWRRGGLSSVTVRVGRHPPEPAPSPADSECTFRVSRARARRPGAAGCRLAGSRQPAAAPGAAARPRLEAPCGYSRAAGPPSRLGRTVTASGGTGSPGRRAAGRRRLGGRRREARKGRRASACALARACDLECSRHSNIQYTLYIHYNISQSTGRHVMIRTGRHVMIPSRLRLTT